MISRFFIDRPIFAAVLSIFVTLTGGIALLSLPIAQYPPITPPAVAVTINYPGASAQVVADTEAAPTEQQVNGVEGMLYMSSQMGNDGIYLSNYATIHVYDELLRIEGVSQINFLGVGNYSMRAWLDPQKLASLNMTAIDVANAIRSQNLDVPAGQIGEPPAPRGQPFQLPIDTLGRLTDPEQFGDIIVKVG